MTQWTSVPASRALRPHRCPLSSSGCTILGQRRVRCTAKAQQARRGERRETIIQHISSHLPRAACFASVAWVLPASPALAAIHTEPANALSLPTWAIHISSTVEWGTAMYLFWRYAEVTGNQHWKGLTWGMLPLLGGAMCACTYHFFYNSPDLDFLVALQAFLTVLGNATCAWAAYRIYQDAQTSSPSS